MKTINVEYGTDGKIASISENSLYFEQESKSLTISAALPEGFDSYNVRAYLRGSQNNSVVTERINKTDGHYDVVVSGEYMSKGTLYAGFELYNSDGYVQRLEVIKIAIDSWITLGKGTSDNVYVVTVNVGETETLTPGEEAYVTNTGTPKDVVLKFGIPQGEKGDTGASGYTPQRGVDYYTEADKQELIGSIEDYVNSGLDGKVDKVTGKGLSSNDFTDDDKSKLDGLSNYDDTEIIRLISEEATARSTADEGKVDKVSGKGLSTNDLTDVLLERLNNQTFDGVVEIEEEDYNFSALDNLGSGIFKIIYHNAYDYHYILFNLPEDGSGCRILFGGSDIRFAWEEPGEGWGDWEYTGLRTVVSTLNTTHPSKNTIYDLGVQTTLSLTLPYSAKVGDWIQVDFISGDTATDLTVTSSAGMTDFDLIPEANMIYSIYFDWGRIDSSTYGWRIGYAEYSVSEV